jgi:hypothetical protein
VVFRLVESAPPVPDDFVSVWDGQPERRPKVPPCEARGLSVYRSLRDAEDQKARLAKRVKAKKHLNEIARGTLQPHMGVTKLTQGAQPTHTTWWKTPGCDPCPFFAVVGPGDEQ